MDNIKSSRASNRKDNKSIPANGSKPGSVSGKQPLVAAPVFYDYRCPGCGRLQFRGYLTPGSVIRIACWFTGCGRRNVFVGGQNKAVESHNIT